MMNNPTYLVDIIGELVAQVSAQLTAQLQAMQPSITGVHYLHGHPLEIVTTLAERDGSDTLMFQKYPLVCLFQDTPEEMNPGIGIHERTRLNLAIVNWTEPSYKAPERYAINFKPILYPIYESLMEAIRLSPQIMLEDQRVKHTKTDRLQWGTRRAGEKMGDFLDAIEITNLNLSIYIENC